MCQNVSVFPRNCSHHILYFVCRRDTWIHIASEVNLESPCPNFNIRHTMTIYCSDFQLCSLLCGVIVIPYNKDLYTTSDTTVMKLFSSAFQTQSTSSFSFLSLSTFAEFPNSKDFSPPPSFSFCRLQLHPLLQQPQLLNTAVSHDSSCFPALTAVSRSRPYFPTAITTQNL